MGRCVLFLVHEGGSVCFASPAVIHSSSFLHNENDIMRSCVKLVPLTHIENDKSHKHSCSCCLHRNSDLSFATRELHGEILTLIHTKLTDCIKITKQYNNQLKSFPAKKRHCCHLWGRFEKKELLSASSLCTVDLFSVYLL